MGSGMSRSSTTGPVPGGSSAAWSSWPTAGSRAPSWSTTRARGAADSGFYDAVVNGSLRYVPRPALDAAVAGAAKRPLGDSWAWARRGLSVDICPLVAVSLARWGHATRAHKYDREPSVYF
jgi:hypothetical protein